MVQERLAGDSKSVKPLSSVGHTNQRIERGAVTERWYGYRQQCSSDDPASRPAGVFAAVPDRRHPRAASSGRFRHFGDRASVVFADRRAAASEITERSGRHPALSRALGGGITAFPSVNVSMGSASMGAFPFGGGMGVAGSRSGSSIRGRFRVMGKNGAGAWVEVDAGGDASSEGLVYDRMVGEFIGRGKMPLGCIARFLGRILWYRLGVTSSVRHAFPPLFRECTKSVTPARLYIVFGYSLVRTLEALRPPPRLAL